MKKFLRWSVTPLGADRIKSTFWRRTYWVAAYVAVLWSGYHQIQEIREEL